MSQEAIEEQREAAAEKKSKRGWLLGIVFIVLVSVLWAAGSIIVQFVADDIGYNQPFVFAYIGSGVMTLFVPSYLGLSLLGLAHNPPFREEAVGGEPDNDGVVYSELEASDEDDGAALQEQTSEGAVKNQLLGDPPLFTDGDSSYAVDGPGRRSREVLTARNVVVADSTPVRPPMKSHLFMLKISVSLSVVWYFTQWCYTASLGYTSVTSSTIISNSAALFAYLFNVAAGTERFTKMKTAGVAMALLGATLVGLGDNGDDNASKESLWGDAAALTSAVGYGVYSTILTVKSPSDDEVSMSLVLGYMGIVNVLIFLPFLVVLALMPGVRVLHGLTLHIVQLIAVKAVMDNLFSELLWARAILLTTPTVATVGCSLTIPVAFGSDFVLHGKVPNALAVSGALMVVGGFYFVSGRVDSGAREPRGWRVQLRNRRAE
ncbi:unnamed protein product [Pylaiella littoralis]